AVRTRRATPTRSPAACSGRSTKFRSLPDRFHRNCFEKRSPGFRAAVLFVFGTSGSGGRFPDDLQRGFPDVDDSAFENPATESSAVVHQGLSAIFSAGLIHPIAGAAFGGTFEQSPTDAKDVTNQ